MAPHQVDGVKRNSVADPKRMTLSSTDSKSSFTAARKEVSSSTTRTVDPSIECSSIAEPVTGLDVAVLLRSSSARVTTR